MGEFELINRYFKRDSSRDDVVLGIGDDGAVTLPRAGTPLVSVLDTLVAGVHYPDELAPYDIGWRAAAVNLSDLAAMAAEPAWMLLGLTLEEPNTQWLQAFAAGLFAAANDHDVALIGGDTTRGTQTVITVQMSGYASPHGFLSRSGAKDGDAVLVSGTIGDAAAGLEIMRAGGDAAYPEIIDRFRRPLARIQLGRTLAGLATAAIDVSDGLFADLERLLSASGLGGTIEFDALALSPELRAYCGRERALTLALGGGDDYELCFTAPEARVAEVMQRAADTGVAVTRIGTVQADPELRCTDGGSPATYRNEGYRHF